MMKKLLTVFLVIAICISCVACGGTNNGDVNNNVNVEKETENPALALERNYYCVIEDALALLETKVKNPASLKINNVIVWSASENTTVSQVESKVDSLELVIYIDFTAKNDFGNEIDDYAGWACNRVIFDQEDNYPVYYKIAHGKNSTFEEVMEGYYKGVESNSLGSVCFEVDLVDYAKAGYILP